MTAKKNKERNQLSKKLDRLTVCSWMLMHFLRLRKSLEVSKFAKVESIWKIRLRDKNTSRLTFSAQFFLQKKDFIANLFKIWGCNSNFNSIDFPLKKGTIKWDFLQFWLEIILSEWIGIHFFKESLSVHQKKNHFKDIQGNSEKLF